MDSARAAMILSLFPLMTLLMVSALGREKLHSRLPAGVVLVVAGVTVALAPRLGAAHPGSWIGEPAVLASAVIGAT